MELFSLRLGGGAGERDNFARGHHPDIVVHRTVNPETASASLVQQMKARLDELREATLAYRVLQLEP